MAEISLGGNRPLDIVTVCKADHWLDDVLPRFAALVDANCSGAVRRHLLLVTEPSLTPADEGRIVGELVRQGWSTVVCRPLDDTTAGRRLLGFDQLRAGVLTACGLTEALYMDPDTDVVEDLQGIQRIAPEADLLWVANPLVLEPVRDDLRRHGFHPTGDDGQPVLMEPGFIYLRRDLTEDFVALRDRFPDVNDFVPGSSYWNMVMLSLGPRASRIEDRYNRTFWDIPSAATVARTVHFTGQWKHVQPYVEYDRLGRRIVIHPRRTVTVPSTPRLPAALAVVAMFRDCSDYLPHALTRFAAWEQAGLPIRYFFLENDSRDSTAARLAEFMRGRSGRLETRRLAERQAHHHDPQHHDTMIRCRMRNFITDIAAAQPPICDHEWTLLLEPGIFFPEDLLRRMFAARARDAHPGRIGLMTCFTQQLFEPAHAPPGAMICDALPEWMIGGHYHDTANFYDSGHIRHHPRCVFARCRRCAGTHSGDGGEPPIPEDRAVVDVAAAFGGLALLPTNILQDRRIRWSSYRQAPGEPDGLAEHLLFCERLRTVTGKRVVVLQDVDCVYSAPSLHPTGRTVC